MAELVALARKIGDLDMVQRATTWQIYAYAELGDRAGLDDTLDRYGELARETRMETARWVYGCGQAMRAILDGDFAAAERLAQAAADHQSGQVEADTAAGIYGLQMFTIRREQDRLADVAPVVKHLIEENPDDATWRPGFALIAMDLGYVDAARRAFTEMADQGFALANDAKLTVTLNYLAEVAAVVGGEAEQEILYQRLLPYRDLQAMAAVTTVCTGAVARFLGLLAGALGDFDAAEEHFESALAKDEAMAAWPWLAHSRGDFAAMLTRRGRPQDHDRIEMMNGLALAACERHGMISLSKRIRESMS